MTTTLTAYQTEELAKRLADTPEDVALFVSEGEFEGFDHSNTADRFFGYADWVGFLPSAARASWVSNGEAEWFDANSLEDAVEQIKSGADLRN